LSISFTYVFSALAASRMFPFMTVLSQNYVYGWTSADW